jgi:hypothetical protein
MSMLICNWLGLVAVPRGPVLGAAATKVDSGISAAAIGAAFTLVVGLVAAVTALATSRKERAGMLIIAAMEHMVGGSQQRSAGLATLAVLRGRSAVPWRFLSRRAWREYAPSVGQHLFRQSIYVLHHGSRRYYAHEIENVIAMVDWLIDDDELSPEQRARLLSALDEYLTPGATAAKDTTRVGPSVAAIAKRADDEWRTRLAPPAE